MDYTVSEGPYGLSREWRWGCLLAMIKSETEKGECEQKYQRIWKGIDHVAPEYLPEESRLYPVEWELLGMGLGEI